MERSAERPWWHDCGFSPIYRLLAQADAADGFILAWGDASGHEITVIDENVATTTPILLPSVQAKREIQVVGSVPYQMGVSGPDDGGIISLVVTVSSVTRIRVFVDTSPHGGVVVVLGVEGEEA